MQDQDRGNICRLCLLNDTKLEDLFQSEEDDKLTKIYKLTNVEIKRNNEYPTGVCFNCKRLLEIAWNFRKQVQESNNFILENYKQFEEIYEIEETQNESEQTEQFENNGTNTEEDDDCYIMCAENSIETNTYSSIINDTRTLTDETNKNGEKQDISIQKNDQTFSDRNKINSQECLENITDDEEGEYNSCFRCKKLFKTEDQFKNHECEISGTNMQTKMLQIFCKKQENNFFNCKVCNKSFTQLGNLEVHLRSHTGDKPYECGTCGKKFTQIGNLNVHKKVHKSDKNFQCKYCNKSFKLLSNLNEHTKIHFDEREFKCELCDYETHKKSSLISHSRIHTGVRPYVCTICSKSFSNSSNFTVHLRTHTGLRPYSCSSCGKSFSQSSARTRHEKMHNREIKTD